MGFNPRTPCGVRPGSMIVSVSPVGFQSTHSLRSATKTPSYFVYDDYVSIHALLAECDYTQPACPPRSGVSIHALLAECDTNALKCWATPPCFNPRTPCGVRPICRLFAQPTVKFQSTHSLRSATYYRNTACPASTSFNPRTPCGVRLKHDIILLQEKNVSIHALLAECDGDKPRNNKTTKSFNPRTPCGVRRQRLIPLIPYRSFNPRTPCGVRLIE